MIRHIVTDCDMLYINVFVEFLESSIYHFSNVTFETVLAFKMNVLKMLEKGNIKN